LRSIGVGEVEAPRLSNVNIGFIIRKARDWGISDTFISDKLLSFLSNHTFLTYLDINLYVDGYFERWGAIVRQMKALEFFGFSTKSGTNESNHENIFEYLRRTCAPYSQPCLCDLVG
jgi:hypothetical protein